MAIINVDGSQEFVGQVIELSESYIGFGRYEYLATVPDGNGGFRKHRYEVENNEAPPCPMAHAVVDAPESLKAEAKAWYAAQERERYHQAEVARLLKVAHEPARGKHGKVVKGRKVPVGTEGEIIWVGEGNFGLRVGIKDEAGTVHWTAASNVKVTPVCPCCHGEDEN